MKNRRKEEEEVANEEKKKRITGSCYYCYRFTVCNNTQHINTEQNPNPMQILYTFAAFVGVFVNLVQLSTHKHMCACVYLCICVVPNRQTHIKMFYMFVVFSFTWNK